MKVIPTDKLKTIMIFTKGNANLRIEPNAAWEDKPWIQEVDVSDPGAKAFVESLRRKRLIRIVKPAKKKASKKSKKSSSRK